MEPAETSQEVDMKFSKLALTVLAFAVIAQIPVSPAGLAACCDGKSKSSPLQVEKNMLRRS